MFAKIKIYTTSERYYYTFLLYSNYTELVFKGREQSYGFVKYLQYYCLIPHPATEWYT